MITLLLLNSLTFGLCCKRLKGTHIRSPTTLWGLPFILSLALTATYLPLIGAFTYRKSKTNLSLKTKPYKQPFHVSKSSLCAWNPDFGPHNVACRRKHKQPPFLSIEGPVYFHHFCLSNESPHHCRRAKHSLRSSTKLPQPKISWGLN